MFAIRNDFFGEKITVTGLITGQDIIKQLSDKELGDELLISSVMLKSDADIFLDDLTLEQVGEKLNVKVRKTGSDGKSFINDLFL